MAVWACLWYDETDPSGVRESFFETQEKEEYLWNNSSN
jgi:hypothetical protein